MWKPELDIPIDRKSFSILLLFALLFAGVTPLDARAVFAAFILTQMVSWFAPVLIKAKPLRP